VAMDARTTVSVETFYSVMRRISSVGSPPFSTLPWPPMVDLLLFVHRVEGLAPGIYMLCRIKGSFERFQQEFSQSFDWKSPENCPSDLRIYRLRQGDFRSLSATISCHQNIASDGVFSAAMLAEFEPALRKYGAPLYPLLFWECGLIGQMLYLEAECSGIKGTGIGCFHDDMIHDLLGVPDRSWQSLYHFTVGGALEDFRLQTMPAYHHLQKIETES